MTKAEFDRAKDIENKIREIQSKLSNLKYILRSDYPVITHLVDNRYGNVSIPNDLRLAIFNIMKELLEKQLTELQSEFDSLVQE